MNEPMKPILFNGEMVNAILEGRKTQTRRILKSYVDLPEDAEFGFDHLTRERGKNEIGCRGTFGQHYGECFIKMPFVPGDILYVRETWGDYRENSEDGEGYYTLYRADYPEGAKTYKAGEDEFGKEIICDLPKWHPSIHMPKAMARIFLKVISVRVGRLQNISGRDVLSEGVDNGASNPSMGVRWENMQRMAFSELWDTTIKTMDKYRYGWAANPWVWVYTFDRITLKSEGTDNAEQNN